MNRVLLIYDDRLQHRLVQAHFKNFQRATYELDWAETYEDGLMRLLSGKYSVCLLDYRLGEKDGLQLIREAAKAGCRTPIVFLTAESSDNVDILAMEAGALDYLVKGEISPGSMERSLRYALKLAETLEALRRLATRDELTGLLNRREYDRVLNEEEDRAERFGNTLALVILDLDHFKAINDTHGHPAGDAVLREVARRLAGTIRTVDRAARIGGEEFALVLVQTDRRSALEVARRAIGLVANEPIKAGPGLSIAVTASAGVAEFPSDAKSAGALFAAADTALYAAKSGGRNRAVPAWEPARYVSAPGESARALHVLTGCTAVGKTEWALAWAEANSAEIISCDSLLFYRGMDIGTAKPSAAELGRVRHHLVDIRDVSQPMNAAVYAQLARAAAEEIRGRGRRILVVGGSGFYLRSFFAPVADSLDVPAETRERVAAQLLSGGLGSLVEELSRLNPGGLGGLDTANPRRGLPPPWADASRRAARLRSSPRTSQRPPVPSRAGRSGWGASIVPAPTWRGASRPGLRRCCETASSRR